MGDRSPDAVPAGIAVVIGAGGGIGAACAVALAASHVHVLCVDRDPHRAKQTALLVRDRGAGAGVVAADAADPEIGDRVVAALDTSAGGGEGDVRSAVHAVAHEEHVAAVDLGLDSMITSYRVGPLAAFAVFRALVVAGRCGPGSALTVIGSLHRHVPFRRCLGYNAAHAALGQVVTTLAHEWSPRRIRVNAVAPGWIATPGEELLYGAEHLAAAGAQLPFGTMGSPEQVADAVAFLSSPAAGYISGTTITVDGALSVSLARLPGEAP